MATKRAPVAKRTAAEGMRAHVATVLGEAATLEAVRQLMWDSLATEKATTVDCPECGHEFRAKLPDIKQRTDAVLAYLEQAEGKPKEAQTAATTVVVVRPPLAS